MSGQSKYISRQELEESAITRLRSSMQGDYGKFGVFKPQFEDPSGYFQKQPQALANFLGTQMQAFGGSRRAAAVVFLSPIIRGVRAQLGVNYPRWNTLLAKLGKVSEGLVGLAQYWLSAEPTVFRQVLLGELCLPPRPPSKRLRGPKSHRPPLVFDGVKKSGEIVSELSKMHRRFRLVLVDLADWSPTPEIWRVLARKVHKEGRIGLLHSSPSDVELKLPEELAGWKEDEDRLKAEDDFYFGSADDLECEFVVAGKCYLLHSDRKATRVKEMLVAQKAPRRTAAGAKPERGQWVVGDHRQLAHHNARRLDAWHLLLRHRDFLKRRQTVWALSRDLVFLGEVRQACGLADQQAYLTEVYHDGQQWSVRRPELRLEAPSQA